MISMFHERVTTQALEAATLGQDREELVVSHANPDVSLGWRVPGESHWQITAHGQPIHAPADAEMLELIAARIGWPSKTSMVSVSH